MTSLLLMLYFINTIANRSWKTNITLSLLSDLMIDLFDVVPIPLMVAMALLLAALCFALCKIYSGAWRRILAHRPQAAKWVALCPGGLALASYNAFQLHAGLQALYQRPVRWRGHHGFFLQIHRHHRPPGAAPEHHHSQPAAPGRAAGRQEHHNHNGGFHARPEYAHVRLRARHHPVSQPPRRQPQQPQGCATPSRCAPNPTAA